MSEYIYTNKLSHEKSPYLLQHAHNPVNWYPWGQEAFDKSTQEDKPIFLSIGYSTCHWCHVMERECFEDIEVADYLNNNFISIKVDREERPDIDHIYMGVCQSLNGQGGWPLTIFMTPDKKPFFAGTYFPKNDRHGLPGLLTLLENIKNIWDSDRDALVKTGNEIADAIKKLESTHQEISIEDVKRKAFDTFKGSFDTVYGGFGKAPKFPTPHNLLFLLRYGKSSSVELVKKTLDSMYVGGIYDHIGGGFCRYSTDQKWLVPHFEKMLYDNALLAIIYLETYQVTRNEKYAEVATNILQYVLRDMTSPEGGFYSAEDADSEGEEGKFYVWTPEEIKQILGETDAKKYCSIYDITSGGNFEGKNIPNLLKGDIDEEDQDFIEICNQKLFKHRETRVHPYKDDKILTAWNGLMIAAMSIGGRVLGNDKYTKAADKAMNFITEKLLRNDGRLLARYREGEAAYPGYADDYAFLIWGLIELYETTYNSKHLINAMHYNGELLKLFSDETNGGLFIYGSDSEQLITRPKEIYDGATPSANSVAAYNMFRLARLTAKNEFEDEAYKILNAFGSDISMYPHGHSFSLIALLFAAAETQEIVLSGDFKSKEMTDMIAVINKDFRPYTVTLFKSDDDKELVEAVPFLKDYKAVNNIATAYVCKNFTCQAPITSGDKLREVLFLK